MKKQQTRNKLTRITIALLLILSMLGNTLILPTVAQEEITPADETVLPETPLDGVSDATGLPTLPEPILLTAADIPEFISSAELTERGAVERMRAEETTMSNVIFRNADGTRTMYMYGLPVKYTTADGTVRDKSTNLVSVSTASVLLSDQPVAQAMAQMSTAQRELLQTELGVLDIERAATTLHMLSTALTSRGKSLSDMAYTTLDNDVYALFPTNLAKGMTLVFGEHSVRMTPAGTGMTVTAGGNVTKTTTSSLSDANVTERLLYPNVFGPGTAVQYTPTLTGVKEEILLARNVGKNSFAFLLETGGLVLTQQEGQYVLVDPTTDETIGSLGSIIVYDSAGEITLGTMTAQTILAGQKYGITISVDQEFLAGATYPVSIDPTITFQTGTTGVIEDLGLYNHADAWSASADEMHYVGLTVIRDYTGAALYRFPFIYDSTQSAFGGSPGNSLFTAAQVGKATLRINVSRISSTEVTLNMKRSNVTWSANGRRICDAAIFASAMSGSNLLSSPVSTPQSGTVDLDLTKIMRDWISFEAGVSTKADPEKGVLLYSNHPSVSLAVNSIRGYDATKYPSLIIEYITQEQTGPYYINNKGNQSFLTYTEEFEVGMARGRVADLGTSMEWVLSYQGDGKYALSPSDYESIWYLNYSGGLSLCTGNPVPHSTWTVMTDNTDFVFRNVSYSDTALSYTTDVYTMIDNVSCNELSETVASINNAAVTNPFKWRMIHKSEYVEFPALTLTEVAFQPEKVNLYDYLNISNYTLTTPLIDLHIYDQGGAHSMLSDGIITPLFPGESFTVNVNHRPTAQFFSFTVHIGTIMEGTYFIKNKGTGQYLSANISATTKRVVSESFFESTYERWQVELLDDGYYSIAIVGDEPLYYMRSLYDAVADKHIATVENSTLSSLRNFGKWKILPMDTEDTGGYYIVPKMGENSGWTLGVNELNKAEIGTYDNASCVHKWELFGVYLTFPARVFYDSSCSLSGAQIKMAYIDAIESFVLNFNIFFDLKTIQYSPELDCSTLCEAAGLEDICINGGNCGLETSCSSIHHRSAQRLIKILTSPEYYTYRLVGYAVCWYDADGHDGVVGGGNVDGKNSVTSTLISSNINRSIQHELTHNLGASHSRCTPGQFCVLKNNYGYWCDACTMDLMENHD